MELPSRQKHKGIPKNQPIQGLYMTLSYTFHLAVEQRCAEIVMRTRKTGRVPVCQSMNTACTWYHGPQGLINLKSKPRTKLQYALQSRGCDPWEPAWLLDRPRVFFQQFRIYQENCKNPRQPIPLGRWVWVKMFNAQKKLDVFRSEEKWQALDPPDRWSPVHPHGCQLHRRHTAGGHGGSHLTAKATEGHLSCREMGLSSLNGNLLSVYFVWDYSCYSDYMFEVLCVYCAHIYIYIYIYIYI